MINLTIEEIISKLVSNSGLTEAEIKTKIQQKMESLSGLISEGGAGHIVANELGVQLFQISGGIVKVKDIRDGMRNVDVIGRVSNKFDVREFTSGARHGKVGSFTIEDETGAIRLTAWNDITHKMQEFNVGDIVKIKSSYVRLNNNGFRELHLNDKSNISINPPGVDVGERKTESKKIGELSENDNFVELLCHVVNVFDPAFFEQCPTCKKRVSQDMGKYVCGEHGEVEPLYSHVVNLLLDDGSGTMRASCWREVADSLFGSLEVIQTAPDMFDSMKNEVLGSIFRFRGTVKKNSMTGNLELNVREAKKEHINLSSDVSSERDTGESRNEEKQAVQEEDVLEENVF